MLCVRRKIEELKQVCNKKRKTSITIKWTIASSIFIFIILTIFAVFTYKSAANVILSKEKQNLLLTENNIHQLLTREEGELTFASVVASFNKDSVTTDLSEVTKTKTSDDTYMADISHPYLSIYIYNQKRQIVFKTNRKDIPYPLSPSKRVEEGSDGIYLESAKPIKKGNKIIGYSQLLYQIENITEMKRELLKIFLFLEFFSIIIAVFFGYYLASYFLQPIKHFRDTMEIIREEPQSKTFLKVKKTNDELEDLGNIFNNMIQEIRNYMIQQEQFVQDASHELRTPIAIIKGHLNLIQRWGKDDPEVLEESITASLEEIQRMQGLVEEMLLLTKSKTIEKVTGEEVSVTPRIEKILNNYRLIHPDYEFEFIKKVKEDLSIFINPNHLDQILIILMDNAIKYAPHSKKIELMLDGDQEKVLVSLRDFGEGIGEKELEKIFRRFYRVDQARSKEIKGNGLGLPIAKELMEHYGGEIKVASIVGQGTTFTLCFQKYFQKEEKK